MTPEERVVEAVAVPDEDVRAEWLGEIKERVGDLEFLGVPAAVLDPLYTYLAAQEAGAPVERETRTLYAGMNLDREGNMTGPAEVVEVELETGRRVVEKAAATDKRLRDLPKPSEVEVVTRRYEFAHGKLPRGRGTWAFHPNFNVPGNDPEIIWSPMGTSYGEAKRQAQAIAAGRGWHSIAVLS